ncbi:hypothetical protein EDB85DRAFT_1894508 [Lactarius pseudohatsudake]|nr:hypothetical protein EDB85DRAFT_1894508 [Lactarius pseudohatsudake]
MYMQVSPQYLRHIHDNHKPTTESPASVMYWRSVDFLAFWPMMPEPLPHASVGDAPGLRRRGVDGDYYKWETDQTCATKSNDRCVAQAQARHRLRKAACGSSETRDTPSPSFENRSGEYMRLDHAHHARGEGDGSKRLKSRSGIDPQQDTPTSQTNMYRTLVVIDECHLARILPMPQTRVLMERTAWEAWRNQLLTRPIPRRQTRGRQEGEQRPAHLHMHLPPPSTPLLQSHGKSQGFLLRHRGSSVRKYVVTHRTTWPFPRRGCAIVTNATQYTTYPRGKKSLDSVSDVHYSTITATMSGEERRGLLVRAKLLTDKRPYRPPPMSDTTKAGTSISAAPSSAKHTSLPTLLMATERLSAKFFCTTPIDWLSQVFN